MENESINTLITGFVNDLKQSGKSEYTLVAYKKDLEQFGDHLKSSGKLGVAEIERKDIESFIRVLIEEKNYTKKSASRKLNSIRTFFQVSEKRRSCDK